MDEILTTTEAGKLLGYHADGIRRLCEDGSLDGAYRLRGGHWRIPRAAVDKFREACRPKKRGS